MTIRKRKNIHVRMIKHLRETHRSLGIWLAAFMIFFAVTGILINHGNQLSIDKSHVNIAWIHNVYGLKAPTDVKKFVLSDLLSKQHIFVVGDQVWLADTLLFNTNAPIVSAGRWQDFIAVVSTNELHLYTGNGELIDVLDANSELPIGISNVAIDGDTIWVRNQQGLFQSDDQLYAWSPISSELESAQNQRTWIQSVEPTSAEKKVITLNYQSQMLTWERVLLDLHSGRIFGNAGVLFMDFVAILLMVLSFTGIYMWVRQARANKH